MSSPPLSKKQPQMEGLFSPRSPIEFVGFAVVNAMIGLLSSGNLLGFCLRPHFSDRLVVSRSPTNQAAAPKRHIPGHQGTASSRQRTHLIAQSLQP